MEPYRSLQPHAGLLLPETERLAQRVLVLPTGTGIDADGIARLCHVIRSAIYQAPEVARKFQQLAS
jgi:dTDP-4-amino-4,6-dideoxygalactose transaminase